MFKAVGKNTQSKHLDLRDRFLAADTVGQSSGNLRDLCNPSPVRFLFGFYG